MKKAEEVMEILEAYDLTGTLRGAAQLSGCDHKTVAQWVRARDAAGGSPGASRGRVRPVTGPFLEKVEELVERSHGKIRADKAHERLVAMGYLGSDRSTRRAVAEATVEVARYLGADPVLVDIDPVTLNIDVSKIRAAITPHTKAIIPVHYAGLACPMAEILAIAGEYGLKVVEDAAHALPATSGGKLIGQQASDVAVFSFYANKTMTTGEGGMAVTRDGAIAERMRVMRLHGMNRDAFDRYTSKTPAWYYEIVAPGFKYNLTDIASAMGIEQLAKLPRFLARRQYLAARYRELLTPLPLILPADAPAGETHAWHLYIIRLADGVGPSRDEVIQGLADRGIGTSVHYVPLHRHPYWRDRYRLTPEMFPRADAAYRSMISIPLFTAMKDADQDRVAAALRDMLGRC